MGLQPPAAAISGFDQINLQTRDPNRAIDFYTDVLGLRLDRADHDNSGSVQFASLRAGDLLIDLQPATGHWSGGPSGLNHFCLLVEPADFDHLRSRLQSLGVKITKRHSAGRAPTALASPSTSVTPMVMGSSRNTLRIRDCQIEG